MSKGLSTYVCSIIKEIEREFEREVNVTEVPYLEEGYRKWMDKKDGKKPSVINAYVSYLKSADKNLFSYEEDFFELLKRALTKGDFDEIPKLFDKYIGIINEWIDDSKKEDVGISTKLLSDWRSGYYNYRKFFEHLIISKKNQAGNTESDNELIKPELPESTNRLFMSNQFADWLMDHEMGKYSASSYISYIKHINKDFFCKITKDNIDPLASIPTYLKEMPDKLMDMLFELEGRLVEEINNKKYSTMPLKSLFNGRTGFRQYIKFMSEIVESYLIQNPPQAETEEDEKDNLCLDTQRTGYEYEDLESNFHFRLLTQDRMSESKDLFFPIRIISRLFHLSEKASRKNNSDQVNRNGVWIDRWANDSVAEITVHTDKGDYILADIDQLEIQPENKRVVVTLGREETAIVLTETENCGMVPLECSALRNIHIDHTPLMSEIIKENSAQLPALQKLTTIIREETIRQNITITTRNFSQISKAVFTNVDLADLETLIPALKEELILLKEKSTLCLMSQSENLKKKQ